MALSRADVTGLDDRLLFGSDMPNTGVTIETAVAHLWSLALDAEAETAILDGNATRLLAPH